MFGIWAYILPTSCWQLALPVTQQI